MVGVGRDLCGSSSQTFLLKKGHLQQAAEDLVQAGLKYLQRRSQPILLWYVVERLYPLIGPFLLLSVCFSYFSPPIPSFFNIMLLSMSEKEKLMRSKEIPWPISVVTSFMLCKLFKPGFFIRFFFHFQGPAQLLSNPYLLLSLFLTALLSCPSSHSHYEQANSWHNVSSCCESPTTSLLDQAYCLVHHWV